MNIEIHQSRNHLKDHKNGKQFHKKRQMFSQESVFMELETKNEAQLFVGKSNIGTRHNNLSMESSTHLDPTPHFLQMHQSKPHPLLSWAKNTQLRFKYKLYTYTPKPHLCNPKRPPPDPMSLQNISLQPFPLILDNNKVLDSLQANITSPLEVEKTQVVNPKEEEDTEKKLEAEDDIFQPEDREQNRTIVTPMTALAPLIPVTPDIPEITDKQIGRKYKITKKKKISGVQPSQSDEDFDPKYYTRKKKQLKKKKAHKKQKKRGLKIKYNSLAIELFQKK